MSCHVTDVSHTDLNVQHVRYTNEGTKDSVTNTPEREIHLTYTLLLCHRLMKDYPKLWWNL